MTIGGGKKMRFRLLLFLVAFAVSASYLAAQTNEEIFQNFQFNFATPGARAAAMGRAFIGLADDSSAAVTNPAGLTNLRTSQFYFELKRTNQRVRRIALENSLATVHVVDAQPTFETRDGTRLASSFYSDSTSVSFLNFSQRFSKVTLGVTYHEFLSFEERFNLGPRPVPGSETFYDLRDDATVFFPVDGVLDMRGYSIGGSLAVEATDWFSLGLTVSADTLDATTEMDRRSYSAELLPDRRLLFTALNDISTRSTIKDSSTKVSFTVGTLFTPGEAFSGGIVYSKGARFGLKQDHTSSPDVDPTPTDTVNVELKVPDRLGGGIAVRPIPGHPDRLTLVFDVVRVYYSQLADNLAQTAYLPSPEIDPELTGRDYSIEDQTEIHFGGEVRPGGGFYLRAGGFTLPDHSLRFTGSAGSVIGPDYSVDLEVVEKARLNTRYQGFKDSPIGITFGGGFAAKGFQADVAWVSIEHFDELVLSFGYGF
jgi:hypothetical protein